MHLYYPIMKLIGRDVLAQFRQKHSDVRSRVDAWIAEVENVAWSSFHDIKQRYASASSIPGGKVVFNLKGNKYRLRVQINYQYGVVKVDRAGTHNEYMNW
jgi:mRNA interferase HigB